jgi:hypothetical protein
VWLAVGIPLAVVFIILIGLLIAKRHENAFKNTAAADNFSSQYYME